VSPGTLIGLASQECRGQDCADATKMNWSLARLDGKLRTEKVKDVGQQTTRSFLSTTEFCAGHFIWFISVCLHFPIGLLCVHFLDILLYCLY
jgi:hypothetical protein